MSKATKKKPKALRVKKLSSLLAIGLRDLRKQERAKNSVVDMQTWLSKCDGRPCFACLAGSVLRFTVGIKPTKWVIWGDIDAGTNARLSALNYLRMGDVPDAAEQLGVKTRKKMREVADYDGPKGQWWKDMKQLHADLIAAGE